MRLKLADNSILPPTSFSYWVVPSLLLAGAYPGHPDPAEHQGRVQMLVDAGIRSFVNLMEIHEKDRNRQPLVPYDDTAAKSSPDCSRRWPFCHRLSGSMNDEPTSIFSRNCCTRRLMNSGPLSLRMYFGTPRIANRSVSSSIR